MNFYRFILDQYGHTGSYRTGTYWHNCHQFHPTLTSTKTSVESFSWYELREEGWSECEGG